MWMWVLHWWCRKHRSGRMSSAHWMAHGRTSIRWENIKCRTNKMPMYVESFYVCAIQNCGSLAFTLHMKWNKRRTTRSVLIVKHEKRKRERKMGKKERKSKNTQKSNNKYIHTHKHKHVPSRNKAEKNSFVGPVGIHLVMSSHSPFASHCFVRLRRFSSWNPFHVLIANLYVCLRYSCLWFFHLRFALYVGDIYHSFLCMVSKCSFVRLLRLSDRLVLEENQFNACTCWTIHTLITINGFT